MTGANLIVLLVGASLISMWFFLSLYLQTILGYSPLQARPGVPADVVAIVAFTSTVPPGRPGPGCHRCW